MLPTRNDRAANIGPFRLTSRVTRPSQTPWYNGKESSMCPRPRSGRSSAWIDQLSSSKIPISTPQAPRAGDTGKGPWRSAFKFVDVKEDGLASRCSGQVRCRGNVTVEPHHFTTSLKSLCQTTVSTGLMKRTPLALTPRPRAPRARVASQDCLGSMQYLRPGDPSWQTRERGPERGRHSIRASRLRCVQDSCKNKKRCSLCLGELACLCHEHDRKGRDHEPSHHSPRSHHVGRGRVHPMARDSAGRHEGTSHREVDRPGERRRASRDGVWHAVHRPDSANTKSSTTRAAKSIAESSITSRRLSRRQRIAHACSNAHGRCPR